MSLQLEILKQHYQWSAVSAICETLQNKGFTAYLAGGCVRDAILGREPKDLDVATNATPEQVEALFVKTVSVGKSFGVIRVLDLGSDIEVATFRTDGVYVDGRRPDSVQFTTAQQDSERRDFTMNALFYDIQNNQILDFVEGVKDIQNRVIRTVGDAAKRFQEDHLRILRAVRFVSQLGFEIEPSTFLAIKNMSALVLSVSAERKTEEMTKFLDTNNVSSLENALNILKQTGLLSALFPGLNSDWKYWDLQSVNSTQRWCLFLLPYLESYRDVPDSLFKDLRFSNKDKEFIQNVFRFLANIQNFFSEKKLSEQVIEYSKSFVQFSLRIASKKNPEFNSQIIEIDEKWISMNYQLPAALLNGTDVGNLFKGAKIGEVLQKAYVLQVEGVFKNKQEALAWLQKQK